MALKIFGRRGGAAGVMVSAVQCSRDMCCCVPLCKKTEGVRGLYMCAYIQVLAEALGHRTVLVCGIGHEVHGPVGALISTALGTVPQIRLAALC